MICSLRRIEMNTSGERPWNKRSQDWGVNYDLPNFYCCVKSSSKELPDIPSEFNVLWCLGLKEVQLLITLGIEGKTLSIHLDYLAEGITGWIKNFLSLWDSSFSYMGQKGESMIQIHLQVISMPSLLHTFSAKILFLLSTADQKLSAFHSF